MDDPKVWPQGHVHIGTESEEVIFFIFFIFFYLLFFFFDVAHKL